MGDAAAKALAEALLEVSAELKANTRSLDRVTLQITRTANTSEDTQAMALNEVRESRALKEKILGELGDLGAKLAVLVDNVKDVEHEVREVTGAHPLQPLEVDDTDKAIGKFVRGVFKKGWVKLAVASGGGLGVGSLFHWILDHLTKGK